MGLARSYYQLQDWDKALAAYREIPRDHELWHDAMFEMSWAYLRSARFRSALSNFQTLHSTYYEDFYLPESLLLRAIVYLYICKYNEMDKVLGLFEKTYGPARARITDFVNSAKDPMDYFNELDKVVQMRRDVRQGKTSGYGGRIPYIIGRHILREGDISRSVEYLKNLNDEQRRMQKFPSGWVEGAVGKYSQRILTNRMKNAKLQIGEMYKNHLLRLRTELRDFYEQAGFIRFEMINGRKEEIRKKMSGKGLPEQQIDEDTSRDFYVQNGYDYWPFRGEFWLDELGNYHYLGKQSCE
ncbi:MAG: tetratricopeptide repeat protein [Pseudobdellovibrionaceae bacterium]